MIPFRGHRQLRGHPRAKLFCQLLWNGRRCRERELTSSPFFLTDMVAVNHNGCNGLISSKSQNHWFRCTQLEWKTWRPSARKCNCKYRYRSPINRLILLYRLIEKFKLYKHNNQLLSCARDNFVIRFIFSFLVFVRRENYFWLIRAAWKLEAKVTVFHTNSSVAALAVSCVFIQKKQQNL